MKATLTRFGIRNFKPTLRKAAEKLDGLRTAEAMPREIEHERLRTLNAAPATEKARTRWFAYLRGSWASASRQLTRHLRDHKAVACYACLTGSPGESGRPQ
jgi:transposase